MPTIQRRLRRSVLIGIACYAKGVGILGEVFAAVPSFAARYNGLVRVDKHTGHTEYVENYAIK